MKHLAPIIVAMLIACIMPGIVAMGIYADTPRTLPLRPRMEWKAIKLDGYVIDVTEAGWLGMIGGPEKEFAWTDSLGTGPRQKRQLVFADRAMRLRAEQMQGVPVCVTAIEVSRGGVSWFLVESITELK